MTNVLRPRRYETIRIIGDSRGIAIRIGNELFLADPRHARELADQLHDAADRTDTERAHHA